MLKLILSVGNYKYLLKVNILSVTVDHYNVDILINIISCYFSGIQLLNYFR